MHVLFAEQYLLIDRSLLKISISKNVPKKVILAAWKS